MSRHETSIIENVPILKSQLEKEINDLEKKIKKYEQDLKKCKVQLKTYREIMA